MKIRIVVSFCLIFVNIVYAGKSVEVTNTQKDQIYNKPSNLVMTYSKFKIIQKIILDMIKERLKYKDKDYLFETINSIKFPTDAQENSIICYYAIKYMCNDRLTINEALKKVEFDIQFKNLNSALKENLENRFQNVHSYLNMMAAKDIIDIAISNANIPLEKANTPFEKEAKNSFQFVKKDINPLKLTEIQDKKDSAKELKNELIEKLNKIEKNKSQTEISTRDESFQDAIIEFETKGNVAVVSFPDEITIDNEVIKGSQEELMNCINGIIGETIATVLYSKNCTLAKNGANILVNVISSPKINKSTDIDAEIKDILWMIIATAIIEGNNTLIIGPIGCGIYEPLKIAKIYEELLESPEFKDKLNNVVFVSGKLSTTSTNFQVNKG